MQVKTGYIIYNAAIRQTWTVTHLTDFMYQEGYHVLQEVLLEGREQELDDSHEYFFELQYNDKN